MILPNFNIVASTPVSNAFKEKGVSTFYDAIQVIHELPYGRNENPLHFDQILNERKGTCSTKHAAIKALAEEHALHGLRLELVIYAMNEKNTPGVGVILEKYGLSYLFEAHVYLCYDEEAYDYTFPKIQAMPWMDAVLIQTTIDTDQIGGFKAKYHRSVLNDWIIRDELDYTIGELWSIREECIVALDQINKMSN